MDDKNESPTPKLMASVDRIYQKQAYVTTQFESNERLSNTQDSALIEHKTRAIQNISRQADGTVAHNLLTALEGTRITSTEYQVIAYREVAPKLNPLKQRLGVIDLTKLETALKAAISIYEQNGEWVNFDTEHGSALTLSESLSEARITYRKASEVAIQNQRVLLSRVSTPIRLINTVVGFREALLAPELQDELKKLLEGFTALRPVLREIYYLGSQPAKNPKAMEDFERYAMALLEGLYEAIRIVGIFVHLEWAVQSTSYRLINVMKRLAAGSKSIKTLYSELNDLFKPLDSRQ